MTDAAKGPWTIRRNRLSPSYAWIDSPEWGALARVVIRVDGAPSAKGKANANLIGSARQLLEALEDVIPFVQGYADSAERDDPVHEMLPRWRAAIAAAKGENP